MRRNTQGEDACYLFVLEAFEWPVPIQEGWILANSLFTFSHVKHSQVKSKKDLK